MEIRRATDEDADVVAALWTEAYTDDPRGGRKAPYAAADFRSTAEVGEILVAVDRRTVGGVVVLNQASVIDGQVAQTGEFELSRLAVAQSHRGRGIGRRLVEACLDLATEQGAPAIVLWSNAHQVEAHQLYEFLGFSRLPDRDHVGATGPRLVFGRSL